MRRTLSPAEVGQAITKLHGHLAAIAETRLRKVAALLTGPAHRARVAAVHTELFAGKPPGNANKGLTRLRDAVAAAAEDAEVDFELCISETRSVGAEHREVWFEGSAPVLAGLGRTEELDSVDVLISDTRGLPLHEREPSLLLEETRDGKPVVRVFISYAQVDEKRADKLLADVRSRLVVSSKYVFEIWQDVCLLPGDDWDGQIREALENCHLGLMLVSPGFLGSGYIKMVEIPAFISGEGLGVPGKRVIPVELEQLDFAHMDLRGLEKRQIYRGPTRGSEPFPERQGKKRKEWVMGLVAKLHDTLDKYATTEPEPPPTPPRGRFRSRDMLSRDLDEIDGCLIEDVMGAPTRLGESLAERREQRSSRGAPLVMDYIMEWLRSPTSPALFALLGEYGMGKTVTCQRLVRKIERHNAECDEELPVPLYFDLRRVTSVRGRDEVPHLREILSECIARGWPVLGPKPTADELLERAAVEPTLFVFDGLDEVLVHLSESRGREFTRELLRVRELSEGEGFDTRVLLSCRTHFFRTLREQDAHFTGQDRGQTSAKDYDAIVLLPLSDEQIRGYLGRVLPEIDIDRATDLVRSVHNLEELAARPYTLKLISEQIPRLEQLRARGEAVRGVTLYGLMVDRWLTRDGGKHHIKPEHKLTLMSHLAAWAWRRGQRLVPAAELEEWFGAWLDGEPALQRRYRGIDFDKLEEDLRTATFLVREDDAESERSGFRFAHTSMQEFFLSQYLFDALVDDAPKRWDFASVSIETWDFFAQRIAERADAPALVSRMSTWARGESRQSRWLVFSYGIEAPTRGWAQPDLRYIDMTDADLKEIAVQGPLDLSGSNWSGADLRWSHWEDVDLANANFERADLRFVVWNLVKAKSANFERARGDGATFRHVDFDRAHGEGVGARCEFIWSPSNIWREDVCDVPNESHSHLSSWPTWDEGHHGLSRLGSWAPDGARVLSAGEEGALRIWDAKSGKCEAVLEGHPGRVFSCQWSPDGTRVLSVGGGTVQIWDAVSGKCEASLGEGYYDAWWAPDGSSVLVSGKNTLRAWVVGSGKYDVVLEDHQGVVWSPTCLPDGSRGLSVDDGVVWVWSTGLGKSAVVLAGSPDDFWWCAWSSDGTRLLSLTKDGTLRVWDTVSGKCDVSLGGLYDNACWSPDGTRVLLADKDGTLRVWDARSSSYAAALVGHRQKISSCAWSPNGARVLSIGHDQIVRVWDVASGECESVLEGQPWPRSFAWSPDSSQVLLGSDAGTLGVWDAASGKCEVLFDGFHEAVRACTWSPDGARMLSVSEDGPLRVWHAESGSCEATLECHQDDVCLCGWSPDGASILAASEDGAMWLWGAESKNCEALLEGHHGRVLSCSWSPDGNRILSVSRDNTARVWDAKSGLCETVRGNYSGVLLSCVWKSGGARVLSVSHNGALRVWDVWSGKCEALLEGHNGEILSCAWSSDGGRLITGGNDRTLRVWNVMTCKCELMLEGHRRGVMACAWSPDGSRVVSADEDGKLRVWNTMSGECEAVLEGHRGCVLTCAWSPDGSRILSAGEDAALRVWNVVSGSMVLVAVTLDGDHASMVPGLRGEGGRIIEASADAWRWLRWKVEFPDGSTKLMPAETFGRLPPSRVG